MSLTVRVEKEIPMPDDIEMTWTNPLSLDLTDFRTFYIGTTQYETLSLVRDIDGSRYYPSTKVRVRARKVRG